MHRGCLGLWSIWSLGLPYAEKLHGAECIKGHCDKRGPAVYVHCVLKGLVTSEGPSVCQQGSCTARLHGMPCRAGLNPTCVVGGHSTPEPQAPTLAHL